MSLASALNWYHQKIGAYDKKLWEKSVDQRILRGVCAIPRKNARIKTELIDVDLVQGSAFAKAKPQGSWIVSTISGIKRIILFPFYFAWWKQQTNVGLACFYNLLYVSQICALYLYFFLDEKELPEVPIFEVVTPLAMMFILGVMHSQIVSTFTPSRKSHKKCIARPRRRRLKSKMLKENVDFEHDKSSPDSASDYKPYNVPNIKSSQLDRRENQTDQITEQDAQLNSASDSDFKSSIVTSETCGSKSNCAASVNQNHIFKRRNFSEDSFNSHFSKDSAFTECNSNSLESLKYGSLCKKEKWDEAQKDLVQNSKDSVFQSYLDKPDISSSEEFFVAKKSAFIHESYNNPGSEGPATSSSDKNCANKSCLKVKTVVCRRYSDIGPVSKKSQMSHLIEPEMRHSADNLSQVDADLKQLGCLNPDQIPHSAAQDGGRSKKGKIRFTHIKPLMELPISLRRFSSSCESRDSSANSPLKNKTSDLEWPLESNTDCNSDISTCSSDYSKDLSDVTPAENPFAWEILERSKKLNKESYPSGKISCTIWEQSDCKKADLTALDICSAIIQKVDSIHHSTEYLFIGVFFAVGLAFLPLMFRLKNGVNYDIQDVASDVFTLTVPTSEEVAKITDGLIDLMWGKTARVKAIVSVFMIERFSLSFSFFFLLSVAEKTFKQRFLYAKHFCYLTSSRGAKRSDLPHFRLNKVKNIKTWLSIRSYMKKLGPQRSVDVIVSITFILEVCVVSYLCIQLLKETAHFSDQLLCWELLFWTLALGIYLLRFMIIGTKINKKYRNLSVLITEQINLYLHMEQKPHKKEELILANNVLKLAADLLKELESPFKISGICANSYLYNITKVVVLSAFSAMLTDVLGFKLKLYKIKLK